MPTTIPKLTLVGAGPGDPELLTLKALKVLRQADVILYDALVNEALLEHAPQAEHIFVGKRLGCHRYMQEQINELIVQRAKTKGHVVRLKGGDPFVFGRGSEEMEFAAKAELETAIVPGLSSALAVPASAQIPLTQRGVSQSFWVITGTTKKHQLSKDVFLAAQSNATVVILMGMSKLKEITAVFKKEGKAHLPVAVIQSGTLPETKMATATVATIVDQVAQQQLTNPAIIVLGEVVRHYEQMQKLQSALGHLNPA